ncbi:MAG: M15 family metallopeptidase [Treponema sp.]|nr:M15 family metallopeptidase [Treponema sp.]
MPAIPAIPAIPALPTPISPETSSIPADPAKPGATSSSTKTVLPEPVVPPPVVSAKTATPAIPAASTKPAAPVASVPQTLPSPVRLEISSQRKYLPDDTQELSGETAAALSETIMKALAAAYPERVGPAEYRNGDWAVPVRGVYYYYAQGKLLPETLRQQAAAYNPQPFYQYPAELPPWKTPGPAEAARLKQGAEERRLHPPKRSQDFYDALWRAHTKEESYERVKSMRFLGYNILIHYSIMEELSLVEERIYAAARTDSRVRQWINNLKSVETWNWRTIAATESRSFHAYGAAIDLLVKTGSQDVTYWLWTSRLKLDWWAIPYEKRLHPPPAVIKAFEDYGFIWGGKWIWYDTMHFEYRPEILLLNNLPLSELR